MAFKLKMPWFIRMFISNMRTIKGTYTELEDTRLTERTTEEQVAKRIAGATQASESRICELVDAKSALEKWIANARPIFEGMARSEIREIRNAYRRERQMQMEISRYDESIEKCRRDPRSVTSNLESLVGNRAGYLGEMKKHHSDRVTRLNCLFEFVLKHELDKNFILTIPGEQMRDWVVSQLAKGDLVNDKLGEYDVPWAQELIAHAMVIASPPTNVEAANPAAEA